MTTTELKDELSRLNRAYRKGNPVVTDDVYDGLLEDLCKNTSAPDFDVFLRTLMEEPGEVKHSRVIGSLRKHKFGETVELDRWLEKYILSVCGTLYIMPKLDGMAFTAKYSKGKLASGVSRGDGEFGTNLTTKLRLILPETVPSTLDFEIRGELTLTDDDHVTLGFKNRRNGTVGLIGRDAADPTEVGMVKAFAYEYRETNQADDGLGRSDQLTKLASLGFAVPTSLSIPTNEIESAEQLQEILAAHLVDLRCHLPFSIDGLVMCNQNEKTENEYYPSGLIAWKMPSDAIQTRVTGIEWASSRNQLIKPVVLLEPIEIDGSRIGRVTGFNATFIRANGLGEGAEVTVIKGGDVIPRIVDIPVQIVVALPETCPSCGCTLSWKGVDLACTSPACGESSVKRVAYFLKNRSIEGASEVSLKNWGIDSFPALLEWTPAEGYKSQLSFYEQIQTKVFKAGNVDLFKAMSCEGLAEKNLDKILSHCGGLNEATALFHITGLGEEPNEMPSGIGMKMLDNARQSWMENLSLLADIMVNERYIGGVNKTIFGQSEGSLSGKTFLITGTLSQPRKAIEKQITDNGGKLASSVSKNLDYLVAGDSAGSKLEKAQKLGVIVLDESSLAGMMSAPSQIPINQPETGIPTNQEPIIQQSLFD